MKTYEQIADKYGLEGKARERYLAYMRQRWTDTEEIKCRTGYAGEWAIRFKEGIEYVCSDGEGKLILQGIDREKVE